MPGKLHPHCEDRKGCHLWPEDLDKAAVQSLADHLLQRTPEQERAHREWMRGEWLFEWKPEGVVKQPNPRHCTLGVGCDEVGQCYASAHGEPDRCGVPGAPHDRCPWDQWKSERTITS